MACVASRSRVSGTREFGGPQGLLLQFNRSAFFCLRATIRRTTSANMKMTFSFASVTKECRT
jgi:hypothetical protein